MFWVRPRSITCRQAATWRTSGLILLCPSHWGSRTLHPTFLHQQDDLTKLSRSSLLTTQLVHAQQQHLEEFVKLEVMRPPPGAPHKQAILIPGHIVVYSSTKAMDMLIGQQAFGE